MHGELRRSRTLAGLPLDVLLSVFSKCDVKDILKLSATCKRLNEASEEHQTWFNQVARLQIPIPTGVVPLTAELKDLAISWERSDELWVKPKDKNNDRSLNIHWLDTRQENPIEENPTRFVMANFVPGGKFVVILYTDCQIDLKEIKIEPDGKWGLQDVAQYKRKKPRGSRMMYWSELLTETNFGFPTVACIDQDEESLLLFLVDPIGGTIKLMDEVALDWLYGLEVCGIHARGGTITCLCLTIHDEWEVTVYERSLDLDPRVFALRTNRDPGEIQFFIISEDAVVMCDREGIRLYHIPELISAEDYAHQALDAVWGWSGDSKWFCGSVCTTFSQHPVLYLHCTSGTHTITFRVDARGRVPVVVNHHISGKLPIHLTSLNAEDEEDHRFVMKGRKGFYYNVSEGEAYPGFATCLLGREELAGGFSAGVDTLSLEGHEVRLADFDERTGRILIGTGRYQEYERDQGTRICFADLPP